MSVKEILMLLESNTYPLPYDDPEEWSKFLHANCYMYALGIKIDQGHLIGDFIGKRMTYHNQYSEIFATFKEEMQFLGFWATECEVDEKFEDGCFKVYIMYDWEGYYHFFRQNNDGSWSHKSQFTLPNQIYSSGKKIENPDEVARYDNGWGRCFMISRM